VEKHGKRSESESPTGILGLLGNPSKWLNMIVVGWNGWNESTPIGEIPIIDVRTIEQNNDLLHK
jgi:hypothetical protein